MNIENSEGTERSTGIRAKIRLALLKFALWRQRFFDSIKRHSDLIIRIPILSITLFVGLAIAWSIDLTDLSAKDVSGAFLTVGAMIGGVLAIVFSLSLFGEQNAANLHLSRHFEIYAHGWRERFIYAVIVIITIFFLAAGIWFNTNPPHITPTLKSITIVFFLLGVSFVFVLVDWQYEIIRTRTNPVNAIGVLEKKAVDYLKKIHRDAKKIAEIVRVTNREVTEERALSVYSSYLRLHLSNTDSQIELLLELSAKLSNRNEILTTNHALTAVHNILAKYLELRKDSSLARLSPVVPLVLTSDSENFIENSLERLNNVGQDFIKDGKTENACYLVNVYRSLATNSKDIKFINRDYENPIFAQIIGNLNSYVRFAINQKEQEVVFRAAQVYTDLALVALEKKLSAPLYDIQQQLYQIGEFGVAERLTYIVNESHRGWLKILDGIFRYRSFHNDQVQITTALKHVENIVFLMRRAVSSGYMNDDFATNLSETQPYGELMEVIRDITRAYFNELQEDDIKISYRSSMMTLFDEIYSSLRSLSERIKNCDSILVDSIGKLISYLNSVMIECLKQDDFADRRIRTQLERTLGGNIHLPTWFVHYSEPFQDSSHFRTLNESIAKTGVLSFKEGHYNLVLDCIKATHSIAKETLNKIQNVYGFAEPRVMLRACYLGVLALKHNQQSVLIGVKESIVGFKQLYAEKYFSNPPTQINPERHPLYLECARWCDEVADSPNRDFMMYDDPTNMMLEWGVDEEDIDRFMNEMLNWIQ